MNKRRKKKQGSKPFRNLIRYFRRITFEDLIKEIDSYPESEEIGEGR